jgi:hypothetical protein
MGNRFRDFFAPPSMAIAEGATTPNPGLTGATVWSTTAGRPLVWDGSAWWPSGIYSFGPDTVGGTTYQLVAADSYKLKRCTNAGAVTVTVPLNVTVAFPVGRTQVYIEVAGAGGLTLSPETGSVSLQGISLTSIAQYQVFTLSKTDTNRWLVS